jgi:hypothetical protein
MIVKISNYKVNGNFCNVKLADGQEATIVVNDNTKTIMSQLQEDSIFGEIDLDCEMVNKNGKIFLWDLKENQPKDQTRQTFSPAPKKADIQKLIVAQNCMGNAVNLYSQRADFDWKKIEETANKMFEWVISKNV